MLLAEDTSDDRRSVSDFWMRVMSVAFDPELRVEHVMDG